MPADPVSPIRSPIRDDAGTPGAPLSRRAALWLTSRLVMAAGLVGGYGMFAWVSSRFMLPAHTGKFHELFVARVSEVPMDSTLLYRTPDGRSVNITRRGQTGTAEDFAALSSTCPHLGCQVFWEGPNNRYFCPCHNGTFDATGRATGGPPADAGQSLPQYGLTVNRGLLYILVPAEQLSMGQVAGLVDVTETIGPGHDQRPGCVQRPGSPGRGA